MGPYEPVAAGPDTVAFVRGGEVFVCTRLRGDAPLKLPRQRRVNVIQGALRLGRLPVQGRDTSTMPTRAAAVRGTSISSLRSPFV